MTLPTIDDDVPVVPADDASLAERQAFAAQVARRWRERHVQDPIEDMRRHLRGIRRVLALCLLLALLYTLAIAKVLLIPLVLAAFIGLALNPIVASAARWRVPRWLSASVLMLGLLGSISTGIGLLAQPAIGWFHDAPSVIRSFVPRMHRIAEPFEAANRATLTLVNGNGGRASATVAPAVTISAWDVITTAPKIVAAVLTVMLLVYFFLIYGDNLLRRAVELAPNFRHKRHTVSVVRSIQTEVSRFMLTTSLINGALGIGTAIMLWLLRVPDPLLWGAVATLANFIPYVGAITTTVVLLLVGSIHTQALGPALLPAFCFACLTAFEGNMITPMILGRRMRLSPVAILLWLLLWGWLWGIPGALLAVPMLTSAKLVAEHVRGLEWFAHMVQR